MFIKMKFLIIAILFSDIILFAMLSLRTNSLQMSRFRSPAPSRTSCLQMKMNTLFDSWKKIKVSTTQVTSRLLRNPIARIFSNTYEFFYWYPRKNLPYDSPWMLFK